jgi:alanine racemase
VGGVPGSGVGLRREALIDLRAISANVLDATGGEPARFSADLRADAYGHGCTEVALALQAAGIGGIIVSHPAEVDALARAGVRLPVLAGTADGHGEHVPTAGKPPLRALSADRIFGIAPASRTTMKLVGEVVSVKTVDAGEGVSYGYSYRTTRKTRLALVGLGFADGIPRSASNRAPVRIGRYSGIVSGRVAMDQFVVDIADSDAHVGADAVLFGSAAHGDPTVHAWAEATGLDPLVVLARLGDRIIRREAQL